MCVHFPADNYYNSFSPQNAFVIYIYFHEFIHEYAFGEIDWPTDDFIPFISVTM